jgi:hypothetical protein
MSYQIAILTIQLVGHITLSSADPAVIQPANDERRAIRERETFRGLINRGAHEALLKSEAVAAILDYAAFCLLSKVFFV